MLCRIYWQTTSVLTKDGNMSEDPINARNAIIIYHSTFFNIGSVNYKLAIDAVRIGFRRIAVEIAGSEEDINPYAFEVTVESCSH